MPNISTAGNVATVIDTFIVEPSKQQALVELLTRATDDTIRHMPGFISASTHKSADGVRVTNYAQWQSREGLEATLRHPDAQPHLREATALASRVDPHVYEVAAVRTTERMPASMPARALTIGALAIGAGAVGAMASGRLAIGALAVRRGAIRQLAIKEWRIDRLEVENSPAISDSSQLAVSSLNDVRPQLFAEDVVRC